MWYLYWNVIFLRMCCWNLAFFKFIHRRHINLLKWWQIKAVCQSIYDICHLQNVLGGQFIPRNFGVYYFWNEPVQPYSQLFDLFHKCITRFTGATRVSLGHNSFHSSTTSFAHAWPVSHLHDPFHMCKYFVYAWPFSQVHNMFRRCTTCFTSIWPVHLIRTWPVLGSWPVTHVHGPLQRCRGHFTDAQTIQRYPYMSSFSLFKSAGPGSQVHDPVSWSVMECESITDIFSCLRICLGSQTTKKIILLNLTIFIFNNTAHYLMF